jgi:hypothetical protein
MFQMHKFKEIIAKTNKNAKRKLLPQKENVQRWNMEFVATKCKHAKKNAKWWEKPQTLIVHV